MGTAPVCAALGILPASFYRYRRGQQQPPQSRLQKEAPEAILPRGRALSPTERAQVLAELMSERFMDLAPRQVYATLLEEAGICVRSARCTGSWPASKRFWSAARSAVRVITASPNGWLCVSTRYGRGILPFSAKAALVHGSWQIADLVAAWRSAVQHGQAQPRSYGGYRPVPCDLVDFFRPRLCGHAGQHYTSQAAKALPAVVLGLSVRVVRLGKTRLALSRQILRQEAKDGGGADLQKRLVEQTAKDLAQDEVLVVDAGFWLAHLLEQKQARLVVRGRQHFTARRNFLPAYKGQGAPPKRGELVRPLARTYQGKTLAATPTDRTLSWCHEGRRIEAAVYETLVLPDALPGSAWFTCVVIRDPRYKEPLVVRDVVKCAINVGVQYP